MSGRAVRPFVVTVTSLLLLATAPGLAVADPQTATPTPPTTPAATATPTATPTPTPTPTDDVTPSPDPSPNASTTPTAVPTPEPSPTTEPSPTNKPTTKAAPRAGVAPQLVPPATGNNAVITVKVGGDRFGVNGVTNLAGVVLGFYAAATGGAPLFTCTSDADGDCSITVGETQPGGANRDQRYWVRQISAPSGWYTSATLRTGQSTAAGTEATPYRFQTGTTLQAGNTYRSTANFMEDTGANNRSASGGIWQNSRNNPVLPSTCGLRVGLVLDLSGSTGPALPQLKQAANTFVDSLVGTPSSMSLFSFSYDSPADGATVNYPSLTPVSTQTQANAFKTRYAAWTSSGGTNWDRGLAVAAEATNRFDVVVVITDGNPTNYSSPRQGSGSFNRIREVENGIFSGNAIKAEGTRVLGVGVGDAITADPNAGLNLRAISGPIVYNGSNTNAADYYLTADYTAAGEALKALAQGNCQGSITVVKQVVPSTAPAGSITGATPDGGWVMTAAGSAGVTVNPPTSGTTADGTGAVNFPLTFAGGTTTGPVTVTETQQPGFTLQQVAGANAVCVRSDTGASIPVTNSGALGFQAAAATSYPLSCTIYNRAPTPEASVVLEKTWIVDGVDLRRRRPAVRPRRSRAHRWHHSGMGCAPNRVQPGRHGRARRDRDDRRAPVLRDHVPATDQRQRDDGGPPTARHSGPEQPDEPLWDHQRGHVHAASHLGEGDRQRQCRPVDLEPPRHGSHRCAARPGGNHRDRRGDRRGDARRRVHARRVGRAAHLPPAGQRVR